MLSEELTINKLKRWNRAYYNAEAVVPDEEYDALYRVARKQFPDNPFFKTVGAPIPGESKAKHSLPMGSLENILYTQKEKLRSWMDAHNNKSGFVLQHKMDGVSIELVYESGCFVQAITRGDGLEGVDVTANVLKARKYFPPSLPKGCAANISVRCEAYILKKHWQRHFEDAANPRAALAMLQRKDGKGCEYLRFRAFDIICDGTRQPTEEDAIAFMADMGFSTVLNMRVKTFDEAWTEYIRGHKCRDDLIFEIDGMVIKTNKTSNPTTDNDDWMRPDNQRAIKFKPRGGVAELLSVEWQLGVTGKITPVAKITPTSVGGVTITSVTLHNLDVLHELDVSVGDEVEVVRGGDVIPKIESVITHGKTRHLIVHPGNCPECGRVTKIKGAFLYCTGGRKCPGINEAVFMNWVKKRNILSIGPSVVHVMCKTLKLTSLSQLYELTDEDLSGLKMGGKTRIGSRADEIINQLESSRNVSLGDFFGSLGIEGVGRTLMNKVISHFACEDVESVMALTEDGLCEVSDFGKDRAKALVTGLTERANEIRDLADEMRFIKPTVNANGVLSGETVCFTSGSSSRSGGDPVPKRSALQKMARDAGANVTSTVTKETTLLVTNSDDATSAKAKKALAQGVKVMGVGEFMEKVTQV